MAFHEAVEAVKPPNSLPKDVSDQLELARDLYAYVWFVYDFLAPAQLQALATLELALRHRLPSPVLSRRRTLPTLLREAVKSGLITDEDFKAAAVPTPLRDKEWQSVATTGVVAPPGFTLERAIGFLGSHRNALAHGDRLLWPDKLRILSIVVALLHCLYPERSHEG